jgi:hypothetical protein
MKMDRFAHFVGFASAADDDDDDDGRHQLENLPIPAAAGRGEGRSI